LTSYYRIMLGRGSSLAKECHEDKWFGGHWDFKDSLENELPDNRKKFISIHKSTYLKNNPEAKNITAGLACGMLYTICKGVQKNDIVLCPDGEGRYWIGKVISDYYFVQGGNMPHRRSVEWYDKTILRSDMSESLRYSTGSIGTVADITKYAQEIEGFVSGSITNTVLNNDETIEDPSSFALEKHLEDFLVKNWSSTLLGENYNIVEENGELIGQQYFTDTGPIDILAISKDEKEILVIELKKGRASDSVMGQISRYMGYITTEIAEPNQKVKGCIIALEDDKKLQYSLITNDNIDFYKYEVRFKLIKN